MMPNPYKLQIETIADPVAWLQQQAATGSFAFLLAHALDGVVWGRVAEKQLHMAAPLHAATLLEARLFGPTAEVYVWPMAQGWQARTVTETAPLPEQANYDESVILWGTDSHGTAPEGFTAVREVDLGVKQMLPLSTFAGRRQARLRLRHYVAYDAQGAAYVALSRLVEVFNENGDSHGHA